MHHLVAAFNGAFKFSTARRLRRPAAAWRSRFATGLGSIVTYTDGTTDVGSWGSERAGPRRRCRLGPPEPAAAHRPRRRRVDGRLPELLGRDARWRRSMRHAQPLGVTADGRLVWAGGEQLTRARSPVRCSARGSCARSSSTSTRTGRRLSVRAPRRQGPAAPVPVVPGQGGIAGPVSGAVEPGLLHDRHRGPRSPRAVRRPISHPVARLVEEGVVGTRSRRAAREVASIVPSRAAISGSKTPIVPPRFAHRRPPVGSLDPTGRHVHHHRWDGWSPGPPWGYCSRGVDRGDHCVHWGSRYRGLDCGQLRDQSIADQRHPWRQRGKGGSTGAAGQLDRRRAQLRAVGERGRKRDPRGSTPRGVRGRGPFHGGRARTASPRGVGVATECPRDHEQRVPVVLVAVGEAGRSAVATGSATATT